VTMAGGIVVGVVQAVLAPYGSVTAYRSAAPFVLSIVALLYLSRHRVVSISRTAQ
jgi:branched-subunit amino acid ABC-type transport system permease component